MHLIPVGVNSLTACTMPFLWLGAAQAMAAMASSWALSKSPSSDCEEEEEDDGLGSLFEEGRASIVEAEVEKRGPHPCRCAWEGAQPGTVACVDDVGDRYVAVDRVGGLRSGSRLVVA
jgi:hypothetical protein